MLSVANDNAAEFEAAQAVCDRLVAEQAVTAAKLEADLAQPREDYDEAVQTCARDKAEYDEAKARFERSRARLLRASSHLNKLERVHDEHSQALKALLTEAHIGAPNGPPASERPAGTRAASGALDAP